jgi:hypothetical protein
MDKMVGGDLEDAGNTDELSLDLHSMRNCWGYWTLHNLQEIHSGPMPG